MSFEPRQEREHVHGARLAQIAVASVVITIASVLVAWGMERATTTHASQYSTAPPPPAGLGTVERSLFLAEPGRGRAEIRARRAELDRWAWVDRDAGLVSMPVDRAIDLWAARHDAAAPPSPPRAIRPVLPSLRQEPGVELGLVAPDWRAR
jgi:hypothetical protein